MNFKVDHQSNPPRGREIALLHMKFVRMVSMDTTGDLNPVASLGN